MSLPILITGGAQRLGLAIAEDLLKQNIPLIVTYRSEKPAVNQLKEQGVTVIQADFSTQAGIERAIASIKSCAPQLRGIIHNASDWDAESSEIPAHELLAKMMQVHASAPYQINLALKDALTSHGKFADIIHMTDYVQNKGSDKHIAYAASKAALHNLTLSFAKLYSPNVKVNSIAPALLMFNEWDDDEYRERSLYKSLLEHIPGAVEAVKAVNYLLDSEYMTGETLHINGGRHLK